MESQRRHRRPSRSAWSTSSASTEAEIEAIQAEVDAEIEEIARFALESPWPKVEEIEEYVFA